jgi:hypothetical protein
MQAMGSSPTPAGTPAAGHRGLCPEPAPGCCPPHRQAPGAPTRLRGPAPGGEPAGQPRPALGWHRGRSDRAVEPAPDPARRTRGMALVLAVAAAVAPARHYGHS